MRLLIVCIISSLGLLSYQAPAELTHRPSQLPDRVILTWAGDPATTQSVTWRTDTSVTRSLAQIAPAEDGPKFVASAQSVAAQTAQFTTDSGDAHVHTVRFTGLKPDTTYAYRVGDGMNWSEWHQFRTASDRPAPLTFLYSGDAQNEIFSHWSRVIRAGFMQAPDARFIVHAGDLVNRGDRDDAWDEWFRAGGWINAVIPSLPSAGNHEYSSSRGGPRALTRHWRMQFDLPQNGPAGLEESCYYVDIQGLRMVSLNSNEQLEEQALWLDELLTNNPNRWTVVAFHHPIFSSARGRDNKELRELWQPIFDKHAVDLVLQGHDHTYARSNVTTGVNARSGRSGTVYVVSVAGPKMYRVEREPWMRRAAEDTQLIQVIRIDGDRLEFEARTPTGRLYDSFVLLKRAGKPNKMIERAPAGPERLRHLTEQTAESGR